MELTSKQTKQMQRVFPNGWEELDIPAMWRKKEERKIEDEARAISQSEEDHRQEN